MKFNISDNVVLRIPMQSINSIRYIFNTQNGDIDISNLLEHDKKFSEALAIANIELWRQIKQGYIHDEQKNSVLKYYIRYLSRPTPYGLFSGISCGRFTDVTQINRDINSYKNSIVDREWFHGLVKILEQDINILTITKVIFNKSCYIIGTRMVNPNFNRNGKHERIRIRYSDQVKFISNYCENWIDFKDLLLEMEKRNKDVESIILLNYISQLINKGYLITDLHGDASKEDALHMLIAKLENQELNKENIQLLQKVKYINELRLLYNTIPIGNGIDLYLKICELMSAIFSCKNYLNVITLIGMEKANVGRNVKNSLENFIPYLLAFSTGDNESSYLLEYKKRYLEKYGICIEVPILELFYSRTGIGDLYNKNVDYIPHMESKKRKIIEEFLHDKISWSIKNGKEVTITNDELEYIRKIDNGTNLDYASSFELNIQIMAQSCNDIDSGAFQIALAHCPGSNRVGKLVNRFTELLSTEYSEEIKKIYESEIKNNNCIIMETAYLPLEKRVINISNGAKHFKYSMSISIQTSNGQEEVDLNSLVVGYNPKSDRLYLKSIKHNQIVMAISDSMLTRAVDNHLIRFMREISYGYFIQPLENIYFYKTFQERYIPQIKMGDVIVQRESWKFFKEEFEDANNYTSFCDKTKKIRNKWQIPQIVYIGIDDKFLLYDMENQTSLKCLYNEMKRIFNYSNWIIIERADIYGQKWLRDTDHNFYTSEIVAEFYNDTEVNLSIPRATMLEKLSGIKKTLSVGEEGWYYFKLYMDEYNADEFLGEHLYKFISYLYDSKFISSYFFIRYRDPQFHIRLRLKVKDSHEIIRVFNEWFNSKEIEEYTSNYTINIYEREIERYGGCEIFELIEYYFSLNSNLVLCILQYMANNSLDLNYVAVVYTLDTFLSFLDEISEADILLDDFVNRNDYRKEFRLNRDNYIGIIEGHYNLPEAILSPLYECSHYLAEIKKSIDQSMLEKADKWDMLLSIIHMFCNRLNGDIRWESKILSITRHSIFAWKARLKAKLRK